MINNEAKTLKKRTRGRNPDEEVQEGRHNSGQVVMPLSSSDGGDGRGGPHLFDKTGGSPVLEQKWTVAPEIKNLPKPTRKSKKRPMPEEEEQIVPRVVSPKGRGGRK